MLLKDTEFFDQPLLSRLARQQGVVASRDGTSLKRPDLPFNGADPRFPQPDEEAIFPLRIFEIGTLVGSAHDRCAMKDAVIAELLPIFFFVLVGLSGQEAPVAERDPRCTPKLIFGGKAAGPDVIPIKGIKGKGGMDAFNNKL